jgi:thiamine-phosphate diphosphorylase
VTICLVTDRRRFDPALEGQVTSIRAAVAAGVDLVQVREPDLETADLASLVRTIVAIARGTRTRVLVNDRLDVALACRADGVHLRSDSIAVGDARRIAPSGFLVGRSVHSVEEAGEAGDADYLIAGTVYPTKSKPDARHWLGADGLRAIVRATAAPVLAIGGVSPERIPEIAATGAAGVAGIDMFLHTISAAFIADLRRKFDTVTPGS